MRQRHLLEAASALLVAGFKPVPLRAGKRAPASPGWQATARATTLENVEALFGAVPWADGLGVLTDGDLVVVDLDRGHGDGADGLATFATFAGFAADAFDVELGPRVRTPRGGVHLWFQPPSGEPLRNRTGLLPGVDIKARGAFAIVPPTIGPYGKYHWLSPPETPLPPLPDWLLTRLRARPKPLVSPVSRRPSTTSLPKSREARRERIITDVLARAASAPVGARNDALFKAAAKLGGAAAAGWLSFTGAAARLMAAAEASALVADDGPRAAEATIMSGLKRGATTPWRQS